MNVGIKYCGGCNPHYDRVEFVEQLKQQNPQLHVEVAQPQQVYDCLLVICGCPAQCANISGLQAEQVRYVYDGRQPVLF